MGFAAGLLAILAAAPAAEAPAASVPDESAIVERDCRVMTEEEPGKVTTTLLPDLHVLAGTRAPGPFRPTLPPGVQAILCTRNSIIPAEHDDEILALGIPLFLVEIGGGGRSGVLEVDQGRFQYSFTQGELKPGEEVALQARMNLFQDRPQ